MKRQKIDNDNYMKREKKTELECGYCKKKYVSRQPYKKHILKEHSDSKAAKQLKESLQLVNYNRNQVSSSTSESEYEPSNQDNNKIINNDVRMKLLKNVKAMKPITTGDQKLYIPLSDSNDDENDKNCNTFNNVEKKTDSESENSNNKQNNQQESNNKNSLNNQSNGAEAENSKLDSLECYISDVSE